MKTATRTRSRPNFFKFMVFFFIIMAITDWGAAGIAVPLLILFGILSSHKGRSQRHSHEKHVAPSREVIKNKSVSTKLEDKKREVISKRELKKKYTKSHPIKTQKTSKKRVSHQNDEWFNTSSWESDERPDAWADAYEPLNNKKSRKRRKR